MNITEQRYALCFKVGFKAVTGLLLRSGRVGEFTDSELETTGDGRLHINGYVWASLLRRALARCRNGKEFAARLGKYEATEGGVSPLWTEAAFIDEKDYLVAINPGNRIHREWGSVVDKALYSDELAYPQAVLPLHGTVFFPARDREDVESAIKALLDAFWVIGQGIETIGGGWSYGFGRLRPINVRWTRLDLLKKEDRAQLWSPDPTSWPNQNHATDQEIAAREPDIAPSKGWTRFQVKAGSADGQLMAIHTDVPELGVELGAKMADHLVFTRPVIAAGKLQAIPVITGKSFRQAVLSREIERILRSNGNDVCLDSAEADRKPKKNDTRRCLCKRCLWFGDIDGGGIISVGDGLVHNSSLEIVHRIQVCEHSRQTMQKKLFNGQYLTRGTFTFNILIDHCRQETTASKELTDNIRALLKEMKAESDAPPGWYRLGATSTCTGQLEIENMNEHKYSSEEASV